MNRTEIGYNAVMRLATLVGSLVLAGILAAGGHATTASRAHLSVPTRSPLTVHGAGFRAGERVTVTVTLVGHVSRKTVTAAAGRFTVRFLATAPKACTAFQVRAVGSLGDRAAVLSTPECAPGPTP